MSTCTGFVTIGQSPRNDILDSMIPGIADSVVVQHGALDELGQSDLEELRPAPGETPFVTRLATGEEALVSKDLLMPYLQAAVSRAISDGATSIVVMCTGAFPSLNAAVPLVFPDRILTANVDAILPAGRLGIIMPHEDQHSIMREKWQTSDRVMIGEVASPYSSADRLHEIARRMNEQQVDLIVLDCMGFTAEMKGAVAKGVSVPVVLANRLVGRVVEELSRN